MSFTARIPLHSSLALAAVLALSPPAQAQNWNWTTFTSPDWEVQLTDAGYSDYLFDLTPGFGGREYLSGEWGAAVGYKQGGNTVLPKWLEPDFSFPNWSTNSNFTTVTPTTLLASNAAGLPVGQSVIANGDLRVSQHFELIDTVTGIAMGATAASVGGAGSFVLSNRYVLQQTYTFTNTSGQTLEGLQLFQFLHGLNSSSGVYDNRAYGGAYGNYRFDTTMQGVDTASGNGGGLLRDYLSFHSKVAPTAVELGYYGIEGVDDHGASAKPGVGTHLSVEADALNNNDSFNQAWVGGAQRYDLGTLGDGQSVSFDVLLSIRSGWQVDGSSNSGSAGGSTGAPGQIDFTFEGDHSAGQFFVSYSPEDAADLRALIAAGEIGTLSFATPGQALQLFEVEYEGSFSGGLRLKFYFDPGLLPPGFDLSLLRIYHWTGNSWQDLGGTLDVAQHTLEVLTDSLSPFAVGAVPEPATWVLALGGLGGLLWRRRWPGTTAARRTKAWMPA